MTPPWLARLIEVKAAAEEDSPATAAEEDSPATAAEEDSPATAAEEDSPATAAEEDSPATAAEEDSPATAAEEDSPATAAEEDSPATAAEEDSPATAAEEDSPATAAEEDSPATAAEEDSPATAAEEDSPATAAEEDSPATAAEEDSPATAAEEDRPVSWHQAADAPTIVFPVPVSWHQAADAPTIVFPVIVTPDAELPDTQGATDAQTVVFPLTDIAPRSNSATPERADEARRRQVRTIVSRAVPPVAILLWLLSLRHVNLRGMGDLGLLQVLPVLFWVALGLLTLGFTVTLWAERITRVLPTVYVLTLITILHATISVLYPTLRYQWSWKHVAVVDAMLRHAGPVTNPGFLNIYNYWPGFFVMNGFVLHFTGLQTAMGYARWATPAANVLMIGPLVLLYRTITRNRKLIWGAIWIYFSCSWIGQDYFAPQTFAFLLFVTMIGLVLKQLPQATPGKHPVPAWAAPPPPDIGGSAKGWSPGLFVMVVLMQLVIVSSHQLTPLMVIVTLAALSLPRRNRRIVLPVLVSAVLLQAVWFATVSRPFIAANLPSFIQALTAPDSNAPTWLSGLGTPAPGQFVLSWIDRGLSAAVILLAVTAWFRRPWTRRTPLPLLAIAPLPMPALNSYGGEMIFRTYMFALPATAMLTATLVLPAMRPVRLRAVASFALFMYFLLGFVFGYYGKEAMNYFTPQEAAATAYLDQVAPTGSTIFSITNNIPNIDNHYDLYSRVIIAWNSPQNQRLLVRDPLAGLEEAISLDAPPGPVYLILNRGQIEESYITGIMPTNIVSRLEAAVDRSHLFAPIFRNADAVVYVLVDRSAPALQPHPQQRQQSQQSLQPGGG